MSSAESKVYFPNLNGLRFIAASMVIFSHTEQAKSYLGLSNWLGAGGIGSAGKLGVLLFFVLSGFLITYLLLEEKRRLSVISVKRFYMRRILRIWPLYYLITVLSLFIIPHIPFFTFPNYSLSVVNNCLGYKALMFALFLSNAEISAFGTVPYGAHTWSVSTEEQFYLIWPLILSRAKNKYAVLVCIILFYLGVNYFLDSFAQIFIHHPLILQDYWRRFCIQSMAFGGIAAVLLHENKNKSLLNFIYNKYSQIAVIIALCCLVGSGYCFPVLNDTFYSILFALLILNLASNPKPVISLENRFFSYMGNISYGLYIFHPIAVAIGVKLICTASNQRNYLLYPVIFSLTTVIAALSYNYFEKMFLKVKVKFALVRSGDEDPAKKDLTSAI